MCKCTVEQRSVSRDASDCVSADSSMKGGRSLSQGLASPNIRTKLDKRGCICLDSLDSSWAYCALDPTDN
jgi:hypothetical protein